MEKCVFMLRFIYANNKQNGFLLPWIHAQFFFIIFPCELKSTASHSKMVQTECYWFTFSNSIWTKICGLSWVIAWHPDAFNFFYMRKLLLLKLFGLYRRSYEHTELIHGFKLRCYRLFLMPNNVYTDTPFWPIIKMLVIFV